MLAPFLRVSIRFLVDDLMNWSFFEGSKAVCVILALAEPCRGLMRKKDAWVM